MSFGIGRDFAGAVAPQIDGKLRPYLRQALCSVVAVGSGAETGQVRVRLPGEDMATADLPWAPVYGAVPAVDDVVCTFWDHASRFVVTTSAGGGGGGVTSFETRTGAVVSAAGDYTATEITNTPAGNIAATTVQAAINELDTEKLAATHTSDADPHTQYHTDARGDVRYVQKADFIYAENALSGSAALSSYDDGTTAMHVTSASSGWPTSSAYKIMTVKTGTEGYQIAEWDGGNTIYYRRWVSGSSSWGGWLQLETTNNKNNASGYAGLDTNSRVASSQLGTGTAGATNYLRGDRAWAVPAASEIANTPAGNVAATTVQTAIDELDTEKLDIGTGTQDATTFRRGDGTWAVPAGGSNYRTRLSVASDVANATTSFADVTGLTFAATSGVHYQFYAVIDYTVNATTTGVRFSMNGPAMTRGSWRISIPPISGAAPYVPGFTQQVAYDTGTASTGHTAVSPNLAIIEGFILPSASGTIALRFASEVAVASGVVVKAGSTLEYW